MPRSRCRHEGRGEGQRSRRMEMKHGDRGCGGVWQRAGGWSGDGNFPGCPLLLCTVRGDGEVRSWLLLDAHGVYGPETSLLSPISPCICRSFWLGQHQRTSRFLSPFLRDVSVPPSAQQKGGRLNANDFHCPIHLLSPSCLPRASPQHNPDACRRLREPQHLQGLRGQSQGARLGSLAPAERSQQDIIWVTVQPGECLAWPRKGEGGGERK